MSLPVVAHRERLGQAARSARHRTGAARTPAGRAARVQRWIWTWVVALLLLLGGGAAPADAAPVRTGQTELSRLGPEAGTRPGDVIPVPHRKLEASPIPGGYNTHDGGWIRFAYPPASRDRVQALIAAADEYRAELTARMGHPVLQHVDVRVARTPAEMATFAPEGAPAPSYATGVAYPEIGLVLLTIEPRYPGERHDLGEVFRHELAHVALHDATAGARVPRWFNEGFAVHASGEASIDRLQTLWTATLANRLLPLGSLEQGFPAEPTVTDVAYAEAADVVRFLVRRRDQARFTAFLERLRSHQPFDDAMRDAYGIDRDRLEAEWREDVARRYTFWPVLLSSGGVWFGAFVLLTWAWRRRKVRAKSTLQRWAREEALDEQRRREAAIVAAAEPPRVHVVLAKTPVPPIESGPLGRVPPPGVPKVEHGGRWHTLH